MTTTKRVLFFFIAGLISVQLISAAGSDEAAEGGGISIDQKFDKSVTLTVQSWFPTEDILNPQLAAFSAEFPNIEIEFQVLSYGEHIEVLKTAWSAGGATGPDIAAYQPGGMIDTVSRTVGALGRSTVGRRLAGHVLRFRRRAGRVDGRRVLYATVRLVYHRVVGESTPSGGIRTWDS